MTELMCDSLHMTEKDCGRGLNGFRMRIHLSAQIGDPDVGLARATEVHILKTTGRNVLLAWRKRGVCHEKKGVIELGVKPLANDVLRSIQANLPFYHAISQTTNNLLLDIGWELGGMKITRTGKLRFAFPNYLVFYMRLNSIHSPLLARGLKDSRTRHGGIDAEAS